MGDKKPLGIIILAAGHGKRMKSDLPKVLHHVGGKPMIAHVIEQAKHLKGSKIVIVVSNIKGRVASATSHYNVVPVEQKERLGTGHAILQTKDKFSDFDGNILILSGDVPLLSQMTLDKLVHRHYVYGAAATVLTTIFENPAGYGRVVRNSDGTLNRIVEHKDCTNEQVEIREVNAGVYIFDSRYLFQCLPEVECDNIQGEYYLPDVLPLIQSMGGKIAVETVEDTREVAGINTQEQLLEMNRIYHELYETS
ncbi:MAG: NTP transferase domain-containing protein [Candidatus Marinimicrobia bacterium]|nr:NTP transferase domain-containing protein [Candidatus Neomarinimicrobiota bacterium]